MRIRPWPRVALDSRYVLGLRRREEYKRGEKEAEPKARRAMRVEGRDETNLDALRAAVTADVATRASEEIKINAATLAYTVERNRTRILPRSLVRTI